MNTNGDNPDVGPVPTEGNEVDLLISRAVDGEAGRSGWVLLEAAAHEDPGVWRRLALSFRDHLALSEAVCGASSAAERTALPGARPQTRPAAAWAGWLAAAAALTFAIFVTSKERRESPVQQAGSPIVSAADALNNYLTLGAREGQVIGQGERQLVGYQPDGGEYVVVYVRPIVERVRVKDLYKFSMEESGVRVPVQVEVPEAIFERGMAY
ncbi:MAG TPA: hypothetical protein VD971_11540 [Phycisphaerales bacterium]|nr:hypothetical protein [Phycisphaerales bacterium]